MKIGAWILALTLLGTAGAASYTVQQGDTMYSIARRSGVSVEELLRLNRLDSDTRLEVGQVLQVPQALSPAPAAAPGASAAAAKPPKPQVLKLSGLTVTAPARLVMGDAFLLKLSGPQAADATVRFPSEIGEDVRQPNEALTPLGAAGEYMVLGRVVLGKTTPVVFEVSLGGQTVRGEIPVGPLSQPIQHLNLPPSISGVLKDPAREAEDAAVEKAYALRTPQQWSKPFVSALARGQATNSSFGQPRTYVKGGAVAYHYGTDYPAPVGTPVLAVNDGTVILAARYPVRGNLVVIDHGAGLTSLYFHQSKLVVKPGQKVVRGQKIGEVGSTGLSAGPHLHLELRVRGEGTDPKGWIGRIWPK